MVTLPSRAPRSFRRTSTALTAAMLALVAASACSSSDDSSGSVNVPATATAGFQTTTNGFGFPNYATGYSESIMTAALMTRMFGTSGVCADTLVPCTLTPAANAWANNANASMDGGRCEGFAVLSSIFFLGLSTPSQFGGAGVHDLVLDGNIPLQEEIAYWYATQDVPAVVSDKTKQFYAKDAIAFLASFLTPGTTDYYRIGFVRKTAHGVAGGHAVTPTGYEEITGQKGVYLLHVYDNNFPDTDRTMTLDTNANRWEYRGSTDPTAASADYVGDEANKNPLYFAPIKVREGVLPCPFCVGATTSQTYASGSASVTTSNASGDSAGLGSDGSLNSAGNGSVQPGFSDIDTWDNAPPVNFILPAGDTTIAIAGNDATTASQILQLGSGYAVQASGLAIASGMSDTLKLSGNGAQASYTNTSGTPVNLSTAVTRAGGGTLQIQVDVPSGSSTVSVGVDDSSGTITATANGTSGQMVTITVTKVSATGAAQSGTLTASGATINTVTIPTSTWMPGDMLTGQQNTGTGTMTSLGDACADGVKDGTESDVDCGGTCTTACAIGKACSAATDCASADCDTTTKKCVAMVNPCADGMKDGTETGTDCGGTCTPCATGVGCAVDADCTSTACDATSMLCVASQCADHRKDGTESDVDCGGSCTACATGKACTMGTDCATTMCTTGVCETLARKLFLSSATYPANLGGLAGADTDCQTLATAAGLPGMYKAFLSDQTTAASDRLTMSTNPYVLVDGTEIAANATNFFSDGHEASMDKTETGVVMDGVFAWTGSFNTGGSDGSQKCASWTSNTLDDSPEIGQSDGAGGSWAQESSASCVQTNHLYCIEQ